MSVVGGSGGSLNRSSSGRRLASISRAKRAATLGPHLDSRRIFTSHSALYEVRLFCILNGSILDMAPKKKNAVADVSAKAEREADLVMGVCAFSGTKKEM